MEHKSRLGLYGLVNVMLTNAQLCPMLHSKKQFIGCKISFMQYVCARHLKIIYGRVLIKNQMTKILIFAHQNINVFIQNCYFFSYNLMCEGVSPLQSLRHFKMVQC